MDDHAADACPTVRRFLALWMRDLPGYFSDYFLPRGLALAAGSDHGPAVSARRQRMIAGWLAQEQAPAWLRLAGLGEEADALAGASDLAVFRHGERIVDAVLTAERVRWSDWIWSKDQRWRKHYAHRPRVMRHDGGMSWPAGAAEDVARAVSRECAASAAWACAGTLDDVTILGDAVTRYAMKSAARLAVRDAGWDAVVSGAGARGVHTAEVEAAREALMPTCRRMQRSGLRLLRALLEVKVDA